MIEINLLRGLGGVSGLTATSTQTSTSQSVYFDPKDIAVKLVVCLIPVMILYAGDLYLQGVANDNYKKKLKARDKLKKELVGFGNQVKQVKKIQEEKARLEKRMNTIKVLSKERLINVKALDALHNVIPKQAWLNDISIKEKQVEMSGLATEDVIVSRLLENLEESIFFTNVNLIETSVSKTASGVAKTFKITCELGEF
ncbi:MAG: PilN domain-containing protein [Bdellovibrionales bacterium]